VDGFLWARYPCTALEHIGQKAVRRRGGEAQGSLAALELYRETLLISERPPPRTIVGHRPTAGC